MRSSRPYVQLDPAVIEQARQMDLLSYLRAYEPNNLVRVGGSVYCTREHDSLKISNGKWFWWSRGIGGVSALDYLIKVKDYGFVEAVEALTGGAVEWTPPQTPKKDEPKVLLLPPKNKDCNRVMQYLFGRGMQNRFRRRARQSTLIAIRFLVKSNAAAAAQAMWQGIKPERTAADIRRGAAMKPQNTVAPILTRQEIKSAVRACLSAMRMRPTLCIS